MLMQAPPSSTGSNTPASRPGFTAPAINHQSTQLLGAPGIGAAASQNLGGNVGLPAGYGTSSYSAPSSSPMQSMFPPNINHPLSMGNMPNLTKALKGI